MSFLSPLAMIGLVGLAPLLWLWRLASTRQQIQVPSLAPFAHLLRRPPRKHSHLLVNRLFWLQLAALLCLVAALMRPQRWARPSATTLIVVDTSASLGARGPGGPVFEEARRRAGEQAEQVRGARLIVATAPVSPLTPEPVTDASEARHAVEAASVADVGGSLSAAAHIGQALLGRAPDRVIVVTDEPAPDPRLARTSFISVGAPKANVAIVGLEAQPPLCSRAPEQVVVTVQNFSSEPAAVRVAASQEGRTVAETSAQLAARERRSVPLTIGPQAEGWLRVAVHASDDALAVDDAAALPVRKLAALPVAVLSEDPGFVRRIGGWLSACEGLAWQPQPPAEGPYLAIADRSDRVPPAAAGALVFSRSGASLKASSWLVATDHPVGAYLPTVLPVAASLATPAAGAPPGEPVVWGVAGGERLPVVVASEAAGRRTVTLLLDPAAMPSSTPLVVLFYNSLRWVMGQAEAVTTGEPLSVPALPAGQVSVERPDGRTVRVEHPGGAFHYRDTTRAGVYRIRAGGVTADRAANFLDPQESNLMDQASTWRPLTGAPPGAPPARSPQPLAKPAIAAALALLVLEWWLYTRRAAGR